jgi:predicted nucleotidyltransferase
MVATREEVLTRLREAKQILQAEFPLKRLALFGSYARATQISGESDVDILVEVEPSIGLGFVTLAERLEQLLGTRVDLVSRRAIKPSLWKLIEPELIDAWARARSASGRSALARIERYTRGVEREQFLADE